MASKSSPEYQATLKSYVNLIEYASLEPGRLCDLFFGAKYISTDVRKFIRDKSQQEMDKARKLIDTIIDQIGVEPNVFHGFMKILKDEGAGGGPILTTVVVQLEKNFESFTREDLSKSLSVSPNQELKEDDGNLSRESSYHSTHSHLTDSENSHDKTAVTYAATADHNNDSGTNLTSLTTGVTVAEPIALKTHSPVSKKGSNTSTGSSGYGSNRDSKISATSSRGSLISTYSTSVIPEESSCYCVESPMAKDHTKEEHLGAKPESPICLGTDTNHMRGRSSAFYRTKDKGRTEETEKIEKSRLKAYLKHMN